jgi:hypothetical protein
MSDPIYPRGKNSNYQRDRPRNASAGLDAVAREESLMPEIKFDSPIFHPVVQLSALSIITHNIAIINLTVYSLLSSIRQFYS